MGKVWVIMELIFFIFIVVLISIIIWGDGKVGKFLNDDRNKSEITDRIMHKAYKMAFNIVYLIFSLIILYRWFFEVELDSQDVIGLFGLSLFLGTMAIPITIIIISKKKK